MAMVQQQFPFLKKTAHAVLSDDRKYRYVLYRSLDGQAWDAEHPPRSSIVWVMLNPSTADENANDPTIDKITKYSTRWGFHRLVVVNLFALRETDSKKLKSLASGTDLIGPDNDTHIAYEVSRSALVVCAWGREGAILARGERVACALSGYAAGCSWAPLRCFKKNIDGSPVHPLYQPDAAELIEYR